MATSDTKFNLCDTCGNRDDCEYYFALAMWRKDDKHCVAVVNACDWFIDGVLKLHD